MSKDLMQELMQELRRHQSDYPSLIHGPLCGQAADEIDNLRASLAKAVEALEEAGITLQHASVFVRSREKMHPDGLKLYDECYEIVSKTYASLTSPERGPLISDQG